MFRLKFFKDPYFLNPWMDPFDTCTVVRYWSKVLLNFIPTQLSDFDVKVKVKDLQKYFFFGLDVLVKVFF